MGGAGRMQQSDCRRQTKKSLRRIFSALIGFFIAVACGVTFMVRLRSDKTYWEYTDYAALIVAAALAAAGFAFGLYELAVCIRDVFFPEKSRLAKSIRAQLPGPDTGRSAEELFGIVDRDISQNGIWFGGNKAAVGQEWVLSDDAVLISRIRAACGRDQITTHRTGSGVRSSRIIACYLLDDQKQTHRVDFYQPDEMRAFLDCLKLRSPDIFFCSYQEYLSCRTSEMEWERMLRDFQHRKNEREFRAMEEERAAYNSMQAAGAEASEDTSASWILPEAEEQDAQQSMPPCLILISALGVRQYHETFTREDVEVAAEGLMDGSYCNVELHTKSFCWMVVEGENGQTEWFHIGVTRPDTDKLRYFSADGTRNQAAVWLMEFYDGRLDTGNPQWRDDTKQMEKKVRKEVRKAGKK